MARVKAPLMSLEASGTVGGSIVFSKWKGRDYVRRHAIPSNPQSGLQTGVRAVFKWISQNFSSLAAADLADWVTAAAAGNLTPLNAMIAEGVDRARRNLGWRESRLDANPGSIAAPTNATATAQPGTLVLAWTDPAVNVADQCIAIYGSVTTGFTPDISNLIAVVNVGVQTWTHTGLTPGTAMYYRARGLSKSGFMGTLIAQFTGTPT